jgi:hypothetical protein
MKEATKMCNMGILVYSPDGVTSQRYLFLFPTSNIKSIIKHVNHSGGIHAVTPRSDILGVK